MPRRYVAKKPRHDWKTPFLAELAEFATVTHACRVADIHRVHAYRMRDRNPAFATAWDEAVERAYRARPVIYRPTPSEMSDRQLMAFLRRLRPGTYREPRYVLAAEAKRPVIEARVEVAIEPESHAIDPAPATGERPQTGDDRAGRKATKATPKKRRVGGRDPYFPGNPSPPTFVSPATLHPPGR